jgi:hypothetical protein
MISIIVRVVTRSTALSKVMSNGMVDKVPCAQNAALSRRDKIFQAIVGCKKDGPIWRHRMYKAGWV